MHALTRGQLARPLCSMQHTQSPASHACAFPAGAQCLGFYTAVWSPAGDKVLTNGFTGALHCWRNLPVPAAPCEATAPQPPSTPPQSCNGCDGTQDDASPAGTRHSTGAARLNKSASALDVRGPPEPVPGAVGHCGPVVDACWGIDGACLLTASSDQTLRITARDTCGHWYEIARPQVHGHDFHAVCAIPKPQCPGHFMFASASEEKVIRVFAAPRAFVGSLAQLRGNDASTAIDAVEAVGATVPALGLSNKAVLDDMDTAAAGQPNGQVGDEQAAGSNPDFAPHQQPTVIQVRC